MNKVNRDGYPRAQPRIGRSHRLPMSGVPVQIHCGPPVTLSLQLLGQAHHILGYYHGGGLGVGRKIPLTPPQIDT